MKLKNDESVPYIDVSFNSLLYLNFKSVLNSFNNKDIYFLLPSMIKSSGNHLQPSALSPSSLMNAVSHMQTGFLH